MTLLIALLVTTILISINALYVAAEFSAVSTRRARMAQLAADGNRVAQTILPVMEDPQLLDRYIATCQLGITISSLMLGFYGRATFARALSPYLAEIGIVSEAAAATISTTLVLIILTGFQVVLGELVPKNVGLQYPERLALYTSPPTRWSMAIFRPLIWFFNGSGQLLMRLLGLTPDTEHAHVHAPEEILMIAEESEAGGLLHQEERRLLENTLQLGDLTVRRVMIPRTRLLTATVDQSCDEAMSRLAESTYSRLLLYEGSIDNIIGVVHLKDLLCLHYLTGQTDMRAVLRPVPFVPETMLVSEVLSLLQRDRYYIAIVLDEYGGTAGMVTLKDLVEEIFGEFQDEFDTDLPPFSMDKDGRLLLRGDTLVRDLNEWIDLYLPCEEVDTIGGLLLSESKHVPVEGEEIEIQGIWFRVEAMYGKAVSAVSVGLTEEQAQRIREMSA